MPPIYHLREEDLDIEQGDFTSLELKDAIKSLNNYKAPVVDFSITAEALKYGGPDLEEKLLALTNCVKNNLTPPLQWIRNLIVPLPKKGDKTKMTNYRGIILMSITAKLYNRLLLNRIRAPLEKKTESQPGWL